MPADRSDWREWAKELYREAQEALTRHWDTAGRPEVEFLKEDLREAMLDLKQAVVDDKEGDGRKYA